MAQALRLIFFVMPFLFGIGFIAPVTAAVLPLIGLAPPFGLTPIGFGLTPIGFGLIFGGLWGAYATWKGRWF